MALLFFIFCEFGEREREREKWRKMEKNEEKWRKVETNGQKWRKMKKKWNLI